MLNLRKPLIIIGVVVLCYSVAIWFVYTSVLPVIAADLESVDEEDNFIADEHVIVINDFDDSNVIIESETTYVVTEQEVGEVLDEIPVELSPFDAYLKANSDLCNLTDDFLTLCATIHYEAGIAAPLESKVAVGHVIVNRLRDYEKWHYNTINDVVYAQGQFSVVHLSDFNTLKTAVAQGVWDENVQATVMAAYLVLTGSELYDIEDDVQFFYGDPNKRDWGGLTYCFTVAGNSYFK